MPTCYNLWFEVETVFPLEVKGHNFLTMFIGVGVIAFNILYLTCSSPSFELTLLPKLTQTQVRLCVEMENIQHWIHGVLQ